MSRRRDAALTVGVAIPLVLAVVVLAPPVRPGALVVGVGGTLLLEGVLLLDRDRVQAVWGRPSVQLATIAGAGVLVALGVALVGPEVLVVVLSGLVTYLCLLAVVSIRASVTES